MHESSTTTVFFFWIDKRRDALQHLDEMASKNFGGFIKMLGGLLMSNATEQLKSKAAAEILRQLDSPSKFIVNIQKGKWQRVSSENKTGIINDVSVCFSKLLQCHCELWPIFRGFYSYFQYFHRLKWNPIWWFRSWIFWRWCLHSIGAASSGSTKFSVNVVLRTWMYTAAQHLLNYMVRIRFYIYWYAFFNHWINFLFVQAAFIPRFKTTDFWTMAWSNCLPMVW